MHKRQKETIYLILDRRYNPLARAVMEGPLDAERRQIRILEEKEDQVMEHEIVQMIGLNEATPDFLGRIIERRRDRIILEPMRSEGESVRENLRVQQTFPSFLYPVSGTWQGRIPVVGNDLSCSGVSFFCALPLQVGEWVEIVLPMTAQPLVAKCEILNCRDAEKNTLYGAKFVDLIDEEISLVREAVFSLQIKNRDQQSRQRKNAQKHREDQHAIR